MKTPEWALAKIEEVKKENRGGHLDLTCYGNDPLISIPDEIRHLSDLKVLHLSKNRIEEFPTWLAYLELEVIYLSDNNLTEFPEILTEIKSLCYLYLSNNKLSVIPKSIGQLRNLRSLELDGNLLEHLPNEIYQLAQLNIFNLSRNKIKELTLSVTQLQNTTQIKLENNPLVLPPIEIATKGIMPIKEYFRQLKFGQDYIYEAKLLIVGEGGAGKTSLAKKIQNLNYVLQDEKSTEGIDVINWSFPIEGEKTFKVNIWDFGGQEIYHATHQFFLTKRSLYILVADMRKEDTDFYYWLNVVELLSDDSPLIIIKNEKQDRHREINERQLRGEFSNLRETIATNFATNRGMNEILNAIRYYIIDLPHIGSPLPKTWVKVRQKLEKDKRNYINLDEYLDICRANGFEDIKDSLQLSEYLHDLGDFLHFQDEPLLKKTVILNPKWGTNAVYKVLDNKTVIKNFGHFTKSDVEKIWNEPQYENMHDELLQVMMKFNLCYKIPNTQDSFIAPQLLTENQPHYEWESKDNLVVRFSYEFMPKGILTQFIVVMHQHIEQQIFVWKSGVLLRFEEKTEYGIDTTFAEVVEHYGKKEIQIRLYGKRKKNFMTIVTHELEKIHSTYKRLKYSKLIPCNCAQCASLNNDLYFYKLDRLYKFLDDGQETIQCQLSYKMVNVRKLIDDIIGDNISKESSAMEQRNLSANYQIKVEAGGNVENIILGSSLQNSINKTDSSIEDNLNSTLIRLTQAVEDMLKHLSEDDSESVVSDLEALKEEAIKKSPREKWYKLSAEGLITAAENVGKIGEPVVKLASQIVAMLMTVKGN